MSRLHREEERLDKKITFFHKTIAKSVICD